jgi:hypothetical protein
MSYSRTIVQAALVLAVMTILLLLTLPMLSHYSMTGRFFPVDIVETLQAPVATTGWDETGVQLADGRTVPLPGIAVLPTESETLRQAIAGGVEITADGRVIGLVPIHHGCGNDPVRSHIARVDIAAMLMYLETLKPEPPLLLAEYYTTAPEDHSGFSEAGWRVGGYYGYTGWSIQHFEEHLAAAGHDTRGSR